MSNTRLFENYYKSILFHLFLYSEPQISADETANVSRSEQKMAAFDDEEPCADDMSQCFLIHTSFLQSLYTMLTCCFCSGSNLYWGRKKSAGFAQEFYLECISCDKIVWSCNSSPKSKSKRFDINVRTVVASKECGLSLATMKKLFNIMNIQNVMHHKTYKQIGMEVRDAAKAAAEEAMSRSAEVVRERYKSGMYFSDQVSTSGVQVVDISYDGTWHKRGYSSHYGVGVVVDIDSGLILDTHTVSNYCRGCEKAPPSDSASFTAWNETHKKSCNKNFDGTSNAMEVEAAAVIFARSVEQRKLIYGTMLCDGDSKALDNVNRLGIYDIKVVKEDCVNHIAKRIYNQLDNLKKSNKSALNRKLTAAKIKKITNTYATNLRDNAPHVEQMKLGVLGGFFHMMSTDKTPNHRLCPKGPTSWCKYNRALANNEVPGKHTPTFTPDIGKIIFPVIKRLTDSDLLKRCAKMTTQNANESFNSTIWQRCPKTQFVYLHAVETAVALAVLSFNMGPSGLRHVFSKLGLSWSMTNSNDALNRANTRIRHARRKLQGTSKWRRKHLQKQHLIQRDKMEQKEGTTYSAGAFNC